jgi:drug/metabolite transporter (DMT)-like permease
MTREKWHGHAAIFTTNILFGLNISIAKTLLPAWISPAGLTLARVAFGAVAFWVLSLFLKRERVSGRDMLVLLACAFLGITVNQTFFIFGLESTSPIDAGLIATLNPVLVMLVAAMILKEPITVKKAGGVLVGACGALLIIWQSSAHAGERSGSLAGNLMCLSSVVSYCVYLVISRPVARRYSPATLMKWMFLFSTIMLLPFGASDLWNARVLSEQGTGEAIGALLYVLAGATFLAYLFIPMALKRIRPTTISMYNYLQPIVAGIAAILTGQGILTWDKPVATLLIFAGVYLVTRSKSRDDIERERRAT